MRERIEGRGQLESWERPEKKIPVEYVFDIITDVLARPGFPPVATKKHSEGRIHSVAGESITQGYYRLFAEDGEILKVQNVGLDYWSISAP
jgi:hypothetical protein